VAGVALQSCPADRAARASLHAGIVAHLPFARTEAPSPPPTLGLGSGSLGGPADFSAAGGQAAPLALASAPPTVPLEPGAAIVVRRSCVLDALRSVLGAPRDLALVQTSLPSSSSSASASSSEAASAPPPSAPVEGGSADLWALQRLLARSGDPARNGSPPASAVIGRGLDRCARTAVHQVAPP
jgi:hypothetical protein